MEWNTMNAVDPEHIREIIVNHLGGCEYADGTLRFYASIINLDSIVSDIMKLIKEE
jgi:hypothetical protein